MVFSLSFLGKTWQDWNGTRCDETALLSALKCRKKYRMLTLILKGKYQELTLPVWTRFFNARKMLHAEKELIPYK